VIKAAYPRSLSLSLSFTCTAFSFSILAAYTYTATRRWARVADTGSFKAIGRIFQGEAALLRNSVRSRLEDLGFECHDSFHSPCSPFARSLCQFDGSDASCGALQDTVAGSSKYGLPFLARSRASRDILDEPNEPSNEPSLTSSPSPINPIAGEFQRRSLAKPLNHTAVRREIKSLDSPSS